MRHKRTSVFSLARTITTLASAFIIGGCVVSHESFAAEPPPSIWDPPKPAWQPREIDPDGSIHVPAFMLPESSLLNARTRAALKSAGDRDRADAAHWDCPSVNTATRATMPAIRRCQADEFYRSALYKELIARYPSFIKVQQIGGVYTEVFTPKDGVAPENHDRVLINVHGGHFESGSRINSRLESIPIAVLGKIEVISIDYRMAPEDTFPAASEDVAAVYRELLKEYKAENIGIYGSSAGGLLAAESVAWFDKHGLPLPGAVGMFAAGATYYQDGDSGHIITTIEGSPYEPSPVHPYFKNTRISDSLAFPSKSPELMAKFPPSLLIASTRDIALSSVVYTHGQLLNLGVEAHLRVWEGLKHCFYYDPTLPESREVYDLITQFFAQHLGKEPAERKNAMHTGKR